MLAVSRTWSEMVYVAFVVDAFSRRILGWRAATHIQTSLVLEALEQAIWTRAPDGVSGPDAVPRVNSCWPPPPLPGRDDRDRSQ